MVEEGGAIGPESEGGGGGVGFDGGNGPMIIFVSGAVLGEGVEPSAGVGGVDGTEVASGDMGGIGATGEVDGMAAGSGVEGGEAVAVDVIGGGCEVVRIVPSSMPKAWRCWRKVSSIFASTIPK